MSKHRRPRYTPEDIRRKEWDSVCESYERSNYRTSGPRTNLKNYDESKPAGQNGDSYSPGLDSKGNLV